MVIKRIARFDVPFDAEITFHGEKGEKGGKGETGNRGHGAEDRRQMVQSTEYRTAE
jgi:hypothetical protein